MVEAEKYQVMPPVSWRTRKVSNVAHSKSKCLRIGGERIVKILELKGLRTTVLMC
jgi:hypothetical protein